MKMKLIAGVATIAVVGGFWACGDGSVNKIESGDSVQEALFANGDSAELASAKNTAFENCKNNPDCNLQYKAYLNGDVEPEQEPEAVESSSSEKKIIPVSSSSQEEITIVTQPSSSSMIIIDDTPTSSAEAVEIVTGLGSCAPLTATIEKGASTKWKFSPNPTTSGISIVQFAGAEYSWDFSGGTPATATGLTTSDITYAASGEATASVNVTVGGKSETIQCAPLQVNGAPITGCKCTPDKKSPDVAKGAQTVTFTVSGCTTDANITTYTWTGNGVTGSTETATATVSKKDDEVKPSVKVGNDDNTIVDVTCSATKAIDSSQPDYILDEKSEYNNIGPGTYSMVYKCKADQYYQTPVIVVAPNGAVTGSANGKAFSVAQYGQSSIFSSKNSGDTINIEITSGKATIKCQ